VSPVSSDVFAVLVRAGLAEHATDFHDFGLETLEDLQDADLVNEETLRGPLGLTAEQADALLHEITDHHPQIDNGSLQITGT